MKKFYCILQHDITDCGAACIATISKQHGLKMPIAQIREIAGTDTKGTSAYGIVKAAENLGFMAKAVKGNPDALFGELPLPCIAHVVVNDSLMHYVVIHKITQKKITIADPGVGIVELTPEEFFGQAVKKGALKYQWTGVLIFLVPGTTFEKKDETVGIFRRFIHLLIPQKKLVIHVFIASLLYTVLGILGAFYFMFLLDEILPSGAMHTLHIISIGVILLNIFMILLSAFRSHLLLYLSQKLDISLILGYYRHVLALPMSFFGTRRVGEIIARFNDASHVRDAISGATLSIMIDSIMVVAGAIILFNQNAFMFGISLVIAVFYLIIVLSFNKAYRSLNKKTMEDNAQLTSYLVESLNGIQTIKSFNAETQANFTTEKKFIALLQSVFRLSWVSNLQETLKGKIELIGGIIIIWIGAIQVLNGDMTVGQLITFNSLLVYFLNPVRNLIDLQPMMHTAISAAQRLGEILDIEVEKTKESEKQIKPQHLRGDIEFKGVDFRYGTRAKIIENISISAKAGEKIAFVGESGSGKTTLVKLLLSMYQCEKGDILINDVNIKDINVETLRDKIAYVPQETFLFSGTIMENLTLGFKDADLEDVIDASKLSKAHDFINELPLRYDTMLEENGANLSGGQRQRLSIARAILKKPDILILDEATSNLDSITENAIEETLKVHMEGVTTFIIAHRLSTVKNADKIYIMSKGKIIEEGNHSSLMKKEGMYYELYKKQ